MIPLLVYCVHGLKSVTVNMRDRQVIIIIMSSVCFALSFSPPRLLLPLLVHPPSRKEGGQEGACQRADLPAVPLDTTGEGHHGGEFKDLK